MAKFCGMIGFVVTREESPGVWVECFEEHKYFGDVLKNVRKWENGVSINDNINISNTISIVGDAFAYQYLGRMRYVNYMGSSWKITNVEIQRPRLILSIGGLWNVHDEAEDSDGLGNVIGVT